MSAKHLGYAVDLKPKFTGLSASEKNVLVQLAQAANHESGECFPSIADIAENTGLSADTVGRCLPVLVTQGYLTIVRRQRGNGSKTSNLYILHLARLAEVWEAQLAAKKARKNGKPKPEDSEDGYPHHAGTPIPEVPAPCGEGTRTMRVGYPHHAVSITKESNLNLHPAQAREGEEAETTSLTWQQFDALITEAAGDAPDMTAPAMHITLPLRNLLNETPNSPACTLDEVIAGVRTIAAWHKAKERDGRMRNWDAAIRSALELRDARLAGHPVKVPEKPKNQGDGLGDPAAFDRETWAKVIDLSNFRRGAWKPEWGPPPGADGSLVPADLVELWKGEAS